MKYKGYIGIAEFDEEGQIFFGRVVNIRDTVTFWSESAKTLEKEFQTSVDEYLAFCERRGETPDKPFSGKFSLRLSPELHEQLVVLAEQHKTSLNDFIVKNLAQLTNAH